MLRADVVLHGLIIRWCAVRLRGGLPTSCCAFNGLGERSHRPFAWPLIQVEFHPGTDLDGNVRWRCIAARTHDAGLFESADQVVADR